MHASDSRDGAFDASVVEAFERLELQFELPEEHFISPGLVLHVTSG
ncbi:hypothetical protein [Corynebacterium tapiri]|nr:hypothetical protein [Corynebacterium tapiri]